MKQCQKCNLEKDKDAFYKGSRYKNGIESRCKECKKLEGIKWRKAKAESRRLQSAEYYLANIEQCKVKSAKWYEANAEQAKLNSSKWRKLNPDKHAAAQAKRHAIKLSAAPSCLTKEQLEEIEWFYIIAKELQWLSEEPLEVDHIVPLQGKNISGLHVPWNLQVLSRSANRY